MTEGSRFVYGNVVIRLTRLYALTVQAGDDSPIGASPPDRKDLTILDRSGTYLVEAFIRTEDGPSATLREKAVEELLKFAKMLEGAIDFRPANRLSLDTVVKGT